jgi:hypothetical protein
MKLFQKRIVCTELDIYVFIKGAPSKVFNNLLLS